MKKLLALATALVLMGVFLPLAVSASTPISNETQLRNALEWGSGGTLTADIDVFGDGLWINTTSTLDLNGHTLTIDDDSMAGLFITPDRTFTIMCSIGTGVFNAISSNIGIYAVGDLTINGGTVYATGGTGIYAQENKITINGGEVNATGGSDWGVGINFGLDGEMHINGGTVNATGSAGINVWGEMHISGGEVNATGTGGDSEGAGIRVAFNSELHISGGEVNATGGNNGAGINVGNQSAISISSGTVNATGGWLGGICVNTNGELNISGGSVNATGYGNGILVEWNGELNISGGSVNATSGNQGAGIFVSVGAMSISGGSVSATGGMGGAGILVGGETNISGGEVNATGGWTAVGISVGGYALNISGGMVNATGCGAWGAAGIRGELSISGGSVNAEGNATRIEGNVTNGAGVPVFLNILTTSPVQSNSAVASASFSGNAYGVKDVVTNASGQLFFWLPATNAAHNATVRIGGTNFAASYTRNADNNNTATLIPEVGLTRADVQAVVDQNPNPPSGAGILPAHVNRFNAARAMAQRVANPSSPNLQHTNEELITASFVNAIMVFENSITRMHSAIARAEQQ
jgi:hypothetical protein